MTKIFNYIIFILIMCGFTLEVKGLPAIGPETAFTQQLKTNLTSYSWKTNLNLPHFNVKDFGAKGDGTTEDNATIQLAIDTAETNGGVVYFPKGTYILGNTPPHAGWLSEGWENMIIIRSNNVTLLGESMYNTILKRSSGVTGKNMLGGGGTTPSAGTYGITNIIVKQLTLDNNGASSPGDITQIYYSDNIMFDSVTFKNTTIDDAVDVNFGGGPVYIENCRFENIGGNVASVQSEPIWMNGCYIIGCGFYNFASASGGLIQQGAASQAWISDCLFKDVSSLFGGGGTSVSAAPAATYISGCSFTFTNAAATNICNDNAVIDIQHSLFVSSASDTATAMIGIRTNGTTIIRDCKFQGNRMGFFIDSPSGARIYNSDIAVTGHSIRARNVTSPVCHIINNIFNTGGSSSGIRLDSSIPASSFLVKGNTFDGVTTAFLASDGSTNHQIINNFFKNVANNAIYSQNNVVQNRSIIMGNISPSTLVVPVDIYDGNMFFIGNVFHGSIQWNASGHTNYFFNNVYSNFLGTHYGNITTNYNKGDNFQFP